MHETVYLFHFCRTNDKSRPSMYSSFAGDRNYFPFWARKCGCAECIIAGDKPETNSLHNQNCYNNSQQRDHFRPKTNGYSQALQKMGRHGEDRDLNGQCTMGNGNGIAVWPKNDRLTSLTDMMQTRDFDTYIQNPVDPRTSSFNQSAVCSQSATTPVAHETILSSRLLTRTDSVLKGNEAVANYWPWHATSGEISFHNQQHLTSIHQTCSTKQSSRDPRLKSKSEKCNGSGALTPNKNSIYQGHDNFLPVSGTQKVFRDAEHQSEDSNRKGYREEMKQSSRQGETTTATWWNFSTMDQHPKLAQAPSVYPATERKGDLSGDDWNVQRSWGKQPMQLTLSEIPNKHDVNEKISCSTIPLSNFSWNHTSLPHEKSYRTSEEKPQKGTKWTIKKRFDDIDSKNSSHQKQQKSRINKKDLENLQDTKILEIYAREERIRNLKALLAKQEQALDVLRFQRKQYSSDELSFINITRNETPYHKSSGKEEIVQYKEESCSSPFAKLPGESLKRRWLKTSSAEDQLDHKPPEKIVKRNETDSHGTLSEDGNQNLSNAEFTALEGLVRLSKD